MGKAAVRRANIRTAARASGNVRRTRVPRHWLALLVLVPLALGLAVAVGSVPVNQGQQNGTLTPERTRHDFGNIPYSGGDATTRFALRVNGPVKVDGLSTT